MRPAQQTIAQLLAFLDSADLAPVVKAAAQLEITHPEWTFAVLADQTGAKATSTASHRYKKARTSLAPPDSASRRCPTWAKPSPARASSMWTRYRSGRARSWWCADGRHNPYAASVSVYDEDDYRRMRLLVTDDGKAGAALHGDEIVSVSAHRDCTHPRAARAMVRYATALDGRRLDCVDTVLPDLYAEAGLVPAARVRWNDDYAPAGWDYDNFRAFNQGRRDVVFLADDPDRVGGRYPRGL
ncbi:MULTISPECIES: hypothetical protein [unclassified Rhodococcus (in: high G+C Gram-positive bacteria)]|uniref:hypothetical protein n=1 Tax=unclassified Rhodococcus (in: high G+C Gram-positive bacteria) TaxID=192944 RepID=UPI0018A7C855|nr:hypothetical protein [Rhodococcus sp. M8]QPG47506.1 hypothetical protein ISO16_11265 [Rhodococcus sp. M8]